MLITLGCSASHAPQRQREIPSPAPSATRAACFLTKHRLAMLPDQVGPDIAQYDRATDVLVVEQHYPYDTTITALPLSMPKRPVRRRVRLFGTMQDVGFGRILMSDGTVLDDRLLIVGKIPGAKAIRSSGCIFVVQRGDAILRALAPNARCAAARFSWPHGYSVVVNSGAHWALSKNNRQIAYLFDNGRMHRWTAHADDAWNTNYGLGPIQTVTTRGTLAVIGGSDMLGWVDPSHAAIRYRYMTYNVINAAIFRNGTVFFGASGVGTMTLFGVYGADADRFDVVVPNWRITPINGLIAGLDNSALELGEYEALYEVAITCSP
jgi:hypothetical protein